MSDKVIFYDVPAEQRLPFAARMVEAAFQRGKRMLVRCADPDEARRLDAFLWTWQDTSFMPHEIVDPAAVLQDPEARVCIVTDDQRPMDAQVLLQLAPGGLDWAQGFPTVLDVVDHGRPEALEASRERYRLWKSVGDIDLSYRSG